MKNYDGLACDVDGVLADFAWATAKYAHVMTGKRIPYDELTEYYLPTLWPEIKDNMEKQWRSIGFCATLGILPMAQHSVKRLYNHFGKDNVRFVTTAMPNSDYWIAERTRWLMTYFQVDPSKIIFTPKKTDDDQSLYLIDDRVENVLEWIKDGRPAILVRQPFNIKFEIDEKDKTLLKIARNIEHATNLITGTTF